MCILVAGGEGLLLDQNLDPHLSNQETAERRQPLDPRSLERLHTETSGPRANRRRRG